MKIAGKRDQQKTLNDLESLMIEVKGSLPNAPRPVLDRIEEIQSFIEASKAAPEDKQIKLLVRTTYTFVQEQFPGLRHASFYKEKPSVTATTKISNNKEMNWGKPNKSNPNCYYKKYE